MIDDGQLDETELAKLEQAAEQLVFDSLDWAKAEPYPPPEALYQDIYYEG